MHCFTVCEGPGFRGWIVVTDRKVSNRTNSILGCIWLYLTPNKICVCFNVCIMCLHTVPRYTCMCLWWHTQSVIRPTRRISEASTCFHSNIRLTLSSPLPLHSWTDPFNFSLSPLYFYSPISFLLALSFPLIHLNTPLILSPPTTPPYSKAPTDRERMKK